MRLHAALVLVAVCATQVCAQSGAAGRFFRDVGQDQITLVKAPLELKHKKWIGVTLVAAGVTTALVLTDTQAVRALPNTPDQIHYSSAVSRAGAIYTVGGLVAGTALVASLTHKPEAAQRSLLAGRAAISAAIATAALKPIFGRERPDINDANGRFLKARDGFPSGHAMISWAVATAVAQRRGCPKWLAITSYVAATGISLSRVGAQRHFPADIVAGGFLGALIGTRMARQP